MTTQPNDNLITVLKLAGFNQTEAKVYLTCLEIGASSAWDIYLKSGIKRPTVYAVLDNLVADGIASKSFDGKRTIFAVVQPQELLLTIDNRKNEFRESLPLFDAVASQSVEKPKIRIYEGIEGVRQAYMLSHAQPEGSEILVFGSPDIWLQYAEANRAYIKNRIEKKLSLRAILPESKKYKKFIKDNEKELRQTRFLPQDIYSPRVETQIFGNTVVYIAHSEKSPFATVIENDSIAFDERQRFEVLWKMAK